METHEKSTIALVDATRKKEYSSGIRLWHWLNALIISGSLLTVLINSTVLKPWTNAGFIAGKLNEKGVKISAEQAKSVAFALADKVWDVHIWLGYALTALLLIRIFLEYFELADKKLLRKIKAARKTFKQRQDHYTSARTEMLVKIAYLLFYVMLFVMVITGLALAFSDQVAILKKMHFLRDIHGFTMYLILAFIAVHIIGVIIGERRQHKGIVSDMINGGNLKTNLRRYFY
jgi:Ni/Fe-hydrogenase 1 B-type cytochrome subunit